MTLTACALQGLITFALTAGTKNEGVIPINKNLWFVSYPYRIGFCQILAIRFEYCKNKALLVWKRPRL